MAVPMMATTANHLLGDISRDTPDLCYIDGEEGNDYIGCWATGFGFFGVKFPKETTRELKEEERELYRKKKLILNGMDLGPAV